MFMYVTPSTIEKVMGVKDGVKACESPISDHTKHPSLPYIRECDFVIILGGVGTWLKVLHL